MKQGAVSDNPAMALPAPVEAFLQARNCPAQFKTVLENMQISPIREIANLAVDPKILQEQVFGLLQLPGVTPRGLRADDATDPSG